MFREDFEFNDQAAPSHLSGLGTPTPRPAANDVAPEVSDGGGLTWERAAENELKKIPFFVRGKARRNTERFALEHGVDSISLETLYEAKAHFGR
jgi:light-independent protochlorophyllide reductase subunit B